MAELEIKKIAEVLAVSMVWGMAAESLDPDNYEALDAALVVLCKTRRALSEVAVPRDTNEH
jgi:hypothetical protein